MRLFIDKMFTYLSKVVGVGEHTNEGVQQNQNRNDMIHNEQDGPYDLGYYELARKG